MHYKKHLHYVMALCATFLLTACTSIHYTQDYKSGTDFSALKTYSWRAITVEVSGTPRPFLQRLIDEQLQSQGFTQAKDNPDFLVDLQVFSRVGARSNTSIGIGIGLPIGTNGSIGLGTSSPLGKGKQEGVMVIDITQAATNTLIWRGNAEAIPLINFTLGAEQKLRASIAELLTPFPPNTMTTQETPTK